MAIAVRCQCGHEWKAGDAARGRSMQCPRCGESVVIGGADATGRSAAEVGQRAAGITALLVRLNIDNVARGDRATAKSQLARFGKWVSDERLATCMSPSEQTIALLPLGDLDDDELFELGWRLEALAVLLWAAGRVERLGAYHAPQRADQLQPYMPVFQPIGPFLASCRPRDGDVLSRERRRAEAWHWRMRTRLLEMQGAVPPFGDTYEACVRRNSEAFVAEGLIETVDGDFDCGGRSYKDLSQPEWASAASIAMERHYALNWLCGKDDWDDIRSDT